MEHLISIIIPVYNVDKELLKSCISSVLRQTYSNIEILLVDDGSIEEVASNCEELAKTDERITVIHQKNQGVSVARNNGTKVAKGEYILYVDADDILACHSLSEAHKYIVENDADITISGIRKIKTHSDFDYSKFGYSQCEVLNEQGIIELKRHYLTLDNPKYIKINGDGYINRGPYCRLIKREIAVTIPFPSGYPIGEDLLWNLNLLSKCRKVCVVYNVWYGYLISSTSAIRKYYGNRIGKVEGYLNCLYNTHNSFCLENIDAYGKNVAAEFYCILRYELLSTSCPLTKGEKNDYVQNMLSRKPWNYLVVKGIKKTFPLKYKILLALCSMNLWQEAMCFNK